ncbi:MAG: DMT family transporter [Pseudomonadota bacterium]
MSLSYRDLFLVLLVVVTWGAHVPIMKLGVMTVEPISLNALRYIFTALLFLPFSEKLPKQDILKLIPVSIFFVCGNLIFAYLALTYITSNSFVIMVQIALPMTILLAYFFFNEKFGLPTTIGILISFIGLLIVFGAPDILASPIGAVLTCLAALSWSIGSIAMKRTGHIKPASFLGYAYLMGIPVAVLCSYIFDTNPIERIASADKYILSFVLLYQVVFMGFMTLVWGGLMARNSAQYVTPFLMLQPVFGVILAYYLLDETLNPNLIYGGILVLIGIGIVNYRMIIRKKITN